MKLSNTYHTVKILDLYPLQQFFDRHIGRVHEELRLTDADVTHAYDWCVMEALNRSFGMINAISVIGHYRHDVYRCVYDTMSNAFESYLTHIASTHCLGFARNLPIKAMVAGSNLFVAQGVPANARL